MEACGRDQKSLFKITKHLLGKANEVLLPSKKSPKELAQVFSDFFIDKIEGIRTKIVSHTQSVSHAVNVEISHHSVENRLEEFNPTS